MRNSSLAAMAIALFCSLFFSSSALAGTVQLPQTGQKQCYDSAGNFIPCAGTGQDGEIQAGVAWPKPRFTDNGNHTVTDNLTGLMWSKNAGTPTVGACTKGHTWQDALDYVACLNSNNYLGHNDWRLPNVNELQSLVDFSEVDPALPSGNPFTNVHASFYWSSTACHSDPDNHCAWYVHMLAGGVDGASWSGADGEGKSLGIYTWPVCGGQCGSLVPSICLPKTGQTVSYAAADDGAIEAGVAWPNPRFTDDGDQTVTDNLTGLIWTKDAGTPPVGTCAGGAMTWQGALDYVACLNSTNYCGHDDWRLPNVREFDSLMDKPQEAGWLPSGNPFTNVQTSSYWSSTTLPRIITYSSYAWYWGFFGVDDKSNVHYVWPVRGGQSTSFPVPHLISGTVKKPNGKGIPNVLMTLSGAATKSIHTDSRGNYSFKKVVDGNYTLTPIKPGFTFAPSNLPVTMNGANVKGQNFTGTKQL